ncbi:thiol reductant ABC exporter subunit CydD [Acidisoma silvae]|uniref:Thiol reductant ABC exporter subunit CydD n=1 Tax=Acidisoma silvae TaxID=2802396 RepID=A0A963YT76_9PROT|nr:thiol reductant ABC exporter subunit CydD [Acidisoma silvae]MCB8876204.1 thiol reductant ABC exporter subunit CydD [Acidisoma silvae]
MDAKKKAATAWLRQQSAQGRKAASGAIVFGLLGTLFGVIQAAAAADLLRALIVRDDQPVLLAAIIFGIAAVLRGLMMMGADAAGFAAGAAGRRRLRSETLNRLLSIGPSLLRQGHSAHLAGIVVDRIEALDGFFARWIPAALMAILAPVMIVVVAAIADPVSALILAACGIFVPFAQAIAGIGAGLAARSQLAAMMRLESRFLDRIRGIGTIVLAGRAEDEAAALRVAADELRVRTMRVLRTAFLSSTALDLAAAVALIGIAIQQGDLILHAAHGAEMAAQSGRALFLLLLVPEMFAPLRAFALAYQDRGAGIAAAEALIVLPEGETDPRFVAEPPAAAPVTVAAHGISVAFEDVHLTWDKARGPALDGVSFRLPAGGAVILAGASGAGKSTVIEILLGFVRPDSGRVLLNGMDMTSIVPQALARLTAWIGQKPVIFATTIGDNIRFAKPEASATELAEAVRLASMDSVIAELPDGLDTMVGEGGFGLSGGQVQRIAIARAFLKNAPLLLLDEPTAHLDPATEAEVLESLKRLAVGRTVIMASHSTQAHMLTGRRLNMAAGRLLLGDAQKGVA